MPGTSAGAKKGAAKRSRAAKGTPCKPVHSTGAKATGSGKSKRAKSFKEGVHPRKKSKRSKGQFDKTSAAQKKKLGKGGTTKAKLARKCRG